MNSTHLPSNDTTIGDSNRSPVLRGAVFAVAAFGMAGIVGLTGCAAPANDRLAVNNIETLDMDVGVQESVTQYTPLATIGRREWSPLTYVVPVDSVVHGPTYAPTVELTNKSARQRGAYPTVVSAYELGEGSSGQQRQEGAIAPFVGFVQGIATIGLVFYDPPTHGDESPSMAYQRSAPVATLRPAIRERASDEPSSKEPTAETERER